MRTRNKLEHITRKLRVYGFASRLYRFYRGLRIRLGLVRFYLLWRKKRYAEFYARRVDKRALLDPKQAVGGLWEEIGKLQFDFLVSQGLKPSHTILDLGCGSLRGGLWFIRYLQVGNYWGLDISQNILEAGRRFLAEQGLENKTPHLTLNRDLKFEELTGCKFDYILAQSVFTHMPEEDIEECLRNLHKILKPSGVFFATFNEGHKSTADKARTTFHYPVSLFEGLGSRYGYHVRVNDSYLHPRGQKMLAISHN